MAPGLSIGTSAFTTQPWMTATNVGMFSPMSMGTSIYSTGTSSSSSSSSYGTANETAEQREKRIERELKRKNDAVANETKKAKQELISEMQNNPDVFAELTDEEEKILLDYMTKMDKATDNKGIMAEGMSVGTAAMCYVPLVAMGGTAVSYVGSGLGWCGRQLGMDKVGNAIAQSSTGKWVGNTYNTVKNSEIVTGTRNFISKVDAAPTNIVNKAASGVQLSEKAAKFTTWGTNFSAQVASKGAIGAAVVTVMDDFDELGVAYKDSFGSGLKQTGQTAVKAGAAAGGFWAGAKGGAILGAKIGALCGPVGAAIGSVVGALGGGLLGTWLAKKAAKAVVGKDVGDKIRDQQAIEAANVKKADEITEGQAGAVGSVLAYAQNDQELDEKTLAVLNKLATRTGMA